MIKFSLPRDTYTPIKFAGHLTTKDVIRLLTPTALIGFFTYTPESLTSTLTGVALGILVGTGWILYRPEGKPVDVHLYNLIRQKSISHWMNHAGAHNIVSLGSLLFGRAHSMSPLLISPYVLVWIYSGAFLFPAKNPESQSTKP
jgi:hypothetical protein